jgi:hypothetical protein
MVGPSLMTCYLRMPALSLMALGSLEEEWWTLRQRNWYTGSFEIRKRNVFRSYRNGEVANDQVNWCKWHQNGIVDDTVVLLYCLPC